MRTIEEVCNQISSRINNYTTEDENKVIKSLLEEILEIEKTKIENIITEEEKFLINYGVPKGTKVHSKIINIIRYGGAT